MATNSIGDVIGTGHDYWQDDHRCPAPRVPAVADRLLELLVTSGASIKPLRVGPERVLLLDDPVQVCELLTVHSRRTHKGRGLVRARLLLGDGL